MTKRQKEVLELLKNGATIVVKDEIVPFRRTTRYRYMLDGKRISSKTFDSIRDKLEALPNKNGRRSFLSCTEYRLKTAE